MQTIVCLLIFLATLGGVESLKRGEQLGDVHTSMAHVSSLVEAETAIVATLQKYLDKEENRLKIIKSYVESWQTTDTSDIVVNPINSYHFLQRLLKEFKEIENALSARNTDQVLNLVSNARSSMRIPRESDINGAAYALVRLQDVYNLTMEDMIQGQLKGRKAFKGLTAIDCLRLGEQSFQNLEFDLSEKWTLKGMEIMESNQKISQEEEKKLERIRKVLDKRKLMRGLLTKAVNNPSEDIVNRFSGLGIPTSFQKLIHTEDEANAQITEIEESYRRLCRGEKQASVPYTGLSCAYVKGDQSLYRLLMPFKIELLYPDPIIALYHDVLTNDEADMLRELALPRLETTQVHSFTSHSAMRSLARIGKTAWVRRGDHPLVDKILKRTEHMTGLSTLSSEDFHILNYGIGGHYDVHVDFFDLHEKQINPAFHRGDRLVTVLFYLNDVDAGGSTVFPSLDISVPAMKRTALVWFNLKRSGKGDYRTVHASCPVLLGQKWIANLWLHEFEQEFRWPCHLNPDE